MGIMETLETLKEDVNEKFKEYRNRSNVKSWDNFLNFSRKMLGKYP